MAEMHHHHIDTTPYDAEHSPPPDDRSPTVCPDPGRSWLDDDPEYE